MKFSDELEKLEDREKEYANAQQVFMAMLNSSSLRVIKSVLSKKFGKSYWSITEEETPPELRWTLHCHKSEYRFVCGGSIALVLKKDPRDRKHRYPIDPSFVVGSDRDVAKATRKAIYKHKVRLKEKVISDCVAKIDASRKEIKAKEQEVHDFKETMETENKQVEKLRSLYAEKYGA